MQEMYDLGKEDTTNLLEKLNQYIDYEQKKDKIVVNERKRKL